MMTNPVHPGEVLREDVIKALGISVKDAAGRLGMPISTLSPIMKCRAAINTELAIRLESAGIGSAQTWLDMQMSYDLAQAQQNPKPE